MFSQDKFLLLFGVISLSKRFRWVLLFVSQLIFTPLSH